MATTTHILGFPRIGEKRELKFALEGYWRGELDLPQLAATGASIRQENWTLQADNQLRFVTAGDFAWYDHVLNMSLLLGHVPQRHRDGDIDMDTLFNIARGQSRQECSCHDGNAASEMTKWFNTNYHYIVPEFSADDTFKVSWSQLFDEVDEAIQQGHQVKPVLLGPLSYLYLGKSVTAEFDRLSLLPQLVIAYQTIVDKLAAQGVAWIQIDEPILALELEPVWLDAFQTAYTQLQRKNKQGSPKLLLTTYFDSITDVLERVTALPVDGLHIDVVSAPQQLDQVSEKLPADWVLSVGVINGRNVWRADLAALLKQLQPLKAQLGERLWIASSCSLLHSPVDLSLETDLSEAMQSWFAFARQKVTELGLLGAALDGDTQAIEACRKYSLPIEQRRASQQVNKPHVRQRVEAINESLATRSLPYQQRAIYQQEALQLPFLPTTTIGSFPQTGEIRKLRRDFRQGHLSESDYKTVLKAHIHEAVERQEALGLDVLVHGEAERNDMVEYFAENLSGFQTTRFGWVQSYGSRCVKPAIIVADIEREKPITVEWSQYAQSLTSKQMKGMLTGPVTILCWTFPREDIPRKTMSQQLALALRDEVADLQSAGIDIIQIDEPAIREGLPLKKRDHQTYLDWAVQSFRIAASSAVPQTQIHTHMCYSEFNEIIESVAALDADVITIETSRSNMELLDAFEAFNYPNEIGPGVYDIHSPNIPSQAWMVELLKKASQAIPAERLWVNPDCGLKTRGWPETEAALRNMVAAAKTLRAHWKAQVIV
ncbi:5-methyltetrahydropteroyltriglutamate--homocysteine S-methyltransferase [Vibrio rhizosphaerae]|uniref:5-methyltetrahydropteroyltriglutamate--homocysteine methyltransferase n=1 Tax=Vibrio rhizosphaerae TaxID=398736 RepID=A0ABU4ITP0_9VIBR|nr:5-methyltetrahydropteroyltriglutamate--homocysteine S-methyltransferase [Vibrio rhizosphaerae]MDW6092771.1 5-methyltetrahydropteroyltriglutamate--homocysteine S-methyltransferase [Vibrio rhizosphaerae]